MIFFSQGLRTHATKGGVVRPGRPPLAYAPVYRYSPPLHMVKVYKGCQLLSINSNELNKKNVLIMSCMSVNVCLTYLYKQYKLYIKMTKGDKHAQKKQSTILLPPSQGQTSATTKTKLH